MNNKRGQYYIVAAVIIIIALFAFVGVANYVKKEKQIVKIYDLSDELRAETANIIDYSIYNEEDVQEQITNFTEQFLVYSEEVEPDSELVFVYGDRNNITILTYADVRGSISINVGGSDIRIETVERGVERRTLSDIQSNDIEVRMLDDVYNFELQEGQNFFFVIRKTIGEEEYVTQG